MKQKIDNSDKWKHACNDTTFVGSKGGASDTVRARNIGLKEENGKRIWEGKEYHSLKIVINY